MGELVLWRVGGSRAENPHMRAFWGSTISFFLAFLGWFALAPLGLDVAYSMGICENQLYDPLTTPKRKAFVKFKDIKTFETYCQYGKLKSAKDCKEVPEDKVNSPKLSERKKYLPDVLPKCLCTGGTECKTTLANAGVASVGSTIFVRVALGTLLERFGPCNVQAMLLSFGAFWVSVA